MLREYSFEEDILHHSTPKLQQSAPTLAAAPISASAVASRYLPSIRKEAISEQGLVDDDILNNKAASPKLAPAFAPAKSTSAPAESASTPAPAFAPSSVPYLNSAPGSTTIAIADTISKALDSGTGGLAELQTLLSNSGFPSQNQNVLSGGAGVLTVGALRSAAAKSNGRWSRLVRGKRAWGSMLKSLDAHTTLAEIQIAMPLVWQKQMMKLSMRARELLLKKKIDSGKDRLRDKVGASSELWCVDVNSRD
jgi:hypothetical protein